MAAMGVVPAFDELEDRHAGLALGFEAAAVEQFAFECGKETLAHRVIEAIADGAHRGPYTGLAATLAKGERSVLGEFKRSSHTSIGRIAMTTQKRRSDRCGRAPLRSPGRPPAARQENYQRFWGLIAAGRSTEDAAIDAGVSPAVGGRWFRRAGGMPPLHFSQSSKPLS